MNGQRMSPLTAFVIGLFGVGAIGVASVSTIVLYGLRIVDRKTDNLIGIVQDTLENAPELVTSLAAIGDKLAGPRSPGYAGKVDVQVAFAPDDAEGGVRPVLTVRNKGEEEVTLLAVRVAALNRDGLPIREWSEVVATPLTISDEWRGPLGPGATRYVVVRCWPNIKESLAADLKAVAEIADLRVRSENENL